MTCIRYFPSSPSENELPREFLSPFNNTPHPLAVKACLQLQDYLTSQLNCLPDFFSAEAGKMFGVLVVKDANNRIAYLAAFSGMLAGQWELPAFVPPVFDQRNREQFLPEGESQLDIYSRQIEALISGTDRSKLRAQLQQYFDQQDDELVTLKIQHQQRKVLRRAKRLNAEGLTVIERDYALNNLSLESQQDKKEKKAIKVKWFNKILAVQQELDKCESQIELLKKSRAELSRSLHDRVFAGYTLINALGEQLAMSELFTDILLPGGAGDCAAPKLLNYAIRHNLKPIAIAEFWWGASPSGGIRHHGFYYPACRGKCFPILPFMLKGLKVEQQVPGGLFVDTDEPVVVYEDDDLLVVNKPCGLLSIPGKEVQDSVLVRLQQRFPDITGPLLVHRLDLATSGLLLVAKSAAVHKALQKQFLKRQVEKRYVALLSKSLSAVSNGDGLQSKGIIDLPLRVDLDDRPRQIVCFEHGKRATTRWEIISNEQEYTRVYFYPITGRTHQLRVHASHPNGLNAAILGDSLYGVEEKRLYLHAESLCFVHPVSGKQIRVNVPAPF